MPETMDIPAEKRVKILIDLQQSLVDWIDKSASINYRARRREIEYRLELARKQAEGRAEA